MIKVAVIGAGFMGSMHAEIYKHFPDIKIAGIVDSRGEKAKSLAEKVGSIPFYDAEQVFAREDITLIDVCLPTYLHKEFVLKAAEAGKDVICEKPIALTLEDAEEMIEVCEKRRVRFMVGHVIRFWPEYDWLKSIADSGRIGKLLSITCTRLSPTPVWGWDSWLTDTSRSGNCLFDLHIHDTDYLLYLVGKKPLKLYSTGLKSNGGYSHIFTNFTFPDGVQASAEGGWDFPANFPFYMAFTATFEKAIVEFNSKNLPLTVYHREGKVEHPPMKNVPIQANAGGNISDLGGYYFELRYFFEHILANKPTAVITPNDARNSLEIILKEQESADTGKEIIL
ncbi:MAG: Gfo/Idh/MocA family oxidoreductase [Candidatus Ratteibacteria bacterium]|jgi:predicted dehydrogenase